jgi:hypothetical protein
MRLQIITFCLLLTLSCKADIIGMIKPNVIYDKKENGKTIELKVEYEVWNYWHTQLGHKWTETYRFTTSGILTLSYGDGNWAGPDKKFWKHRYQFLDKKRLKDYCYDYKKSTTTYPETKNFLSYIDTVEIDNEFNRVTLDKVKSYITENTRAFESRDKMFSGKNKVVEKTFDAIANELLDKLNTKEQSKPKTSYTWTYVVGVTILVSTFAFVLLKRRRKNYRS